MMTGKYRAYSEYKNSGVKWLGVIPSQWALSKHKYIARFQKGKNPSLLMVESQEGTLRYLSMDYLRGNATSTFAKAESNSYVAKEGQVLIIWDGSNAGEFVKAEIGIVSSTMAASEFISNIDKSFYWYVCLCLEPEMRRHANGMGIPHVDGDELKLSLVPIPTMLEQQIIANFLDHETAKIDTLIEKQQQLIKLLKEKRQAVISHAVTKGLNPNAPMRDSGVEWLGEVPEHWIVSKIKYFATMQGGYAFSSDSFQEYGVQLLRIGNVYLNRLALERQPVFLDKSFLKSHKDFVVCHGDILMSLTGTLGKTDYGYAVRVDENGAFMLNQRVAKIIPNKDKVTSNYLLYSIRSDSYLKQLYSLPSGTKQANLSNDNVLNISIAIPPNLEEQNEISNFINENLKKYKELIGECFSAIELMQERRIALISEAVTGKIDVRSWQAPSQTTNQKIAA